MVCKNYSITKKATQMLVKSVSINAIILIRTLDVRVKLIPRYKGRLEMILSRDLCFVALTLKVAPCPSSCGKLQMWWKVVEEDGKRVLKEIPEDEGERAQRVIEDGGDEGVSKLEGERILLFPLCAGR